MGSAWTLRGARADPHQLEASRLAAYCLPEHPGLSRSRATRELDHVLAATFGFWEQILPAAKRYRR